METLTLTKSADKVTEWRSQLEQWTGQTPEAKVMAGASEYLLSLFYAIIGLGCQLQVRE